MNYFITDFGACPDGTHYVQRLFNPLLTPALLRAEAKS